MMIQIWHDVSLSSPSIRPRVLEMDKEENRHPSLSRHRRHSGSSENYWRRGQDYDKHRESSGRKVKMRRHWTLLTHSHTHTYKYIRSFMYFSIVTFFDQTLFSCSSFSLVQGAPSSCRLHFDLRLDHFECIFVPGGRSWRLCYTLYNLKLLTTLRLCC